MTATELRAWREAAKLTQTQAALRLGLTLRSYQYAEARGPTPAVAAHVETLKAPT